MDEMLRSIIDHIEWATSVNMTGIAVVLGLVLIVAFIVAVSRPWGYQPANPRPLNSPPRGRGPARPIRDTPSRFDGIPRAAKDGMDAFSAIERDATVAHIMRLKANPAHNFDETDQLMLDYLTTPPPER